ncbi:hypothetical protein ACJQWK_10048 [Exserohilum turcicum]
MLGLMRFALQHPYADKDYYMAQLSNTCCSYRMNRDDLPHTHAVEETLRERFVPSCSLPQASDWSKADTCAEEKLTNSANVEGQLSEVCSPSHAWHSCKNHICM